MSNMPTYVSLAENSRLELEGAVSRLLLAQQALADFHTQTAVVTDEEFPSTATGRDSAMLERQLRMLLTEVDEAERQYRKAFAECLRQTELPTPR